MTETASTRVRVAAGSANALGLLALVLTLGLLAFAPLGAVAARVGIAAAFATVIAGGLVYACAGTAASPAGGPSSATSLILGGLVAQLAHDPAADLASLVAVSGAGVVLMGVLQILFGLLGLGKLARFVPQPVLAGFMNGVALMILVSQLPALLGATDLAHAQPLTLVVGLVTAGTVWLLAWKWPRSPAPLFALLVGSATYAALAAAFPGAALGPTVGELPRGFVVPGALGPLAGPQGWALLQRHFSAVFSTAVVLAVIGSLESLVAALATDQAAQTRHDPNRELMALGAANMASGACGGLPLVLLRARALLLIASGARGRVAVGAAVPAYVLMYATGGALLALLPKTVLAGVMLTIAVALMDRWTRQLLGQFQAGEHSAELRLSLAVVFIVCAVTIKWGFVWGVGSGVLLAMLVFIQSMNRSLIRGRYTGVERPSRRVYGQSQENLLRDRRRSVILFELEGALFFGSAERLASETDVLPADCRCLVIDLRRVSMIDESGAMVLEQLSRRLTQRDVRLLMAGVSAENPHGRRLRAFGCFREEERADWWPDADRAMESAELQLLLEAGVSEPQAAVPLEKSSLLRGLDSVQSERVKAVLQEQNLALDELLFREGDPGDRLFVLTEGSVSIVGSNQRFLSFSPGMMFGETAMLDGGGRSAAAVADSAAVVYTFTREALDSLATADPLLGERLMRNIAIHLTERLRGATSAWRSSLE